MGGGGTIISYNVYISSSSEPRRENTDDSGARNHTYRVHVCVCVCVCVWLVHKIKPKIRPRN